MRLKCIVALLGLLTLMTGCAGQTNGTAAPGEQAPTQQSSSPAEPTPTTAAAAVKPCELLPQAEAERLAGTPLQPGTESGSQTETITCTYGPLPTGRTAQVELYVGIGVKKYYDIDVQLGHKFWPIAGLGDEAHAEDNTVFFRKSTTWVGLRLVLLNDPAENRAPLEALARTVADRLRR
jgi:hypothetical protein